uniref:Uncharacterized protein n=1 Tax=Lotharella oceanica TaxID=641309 RepID=A0A7S2TN41_9EUKA|mmetsp:Transcript_20212/g.38026  ORF Transcript_20212/g.38026 Transcript_20212/m.38026 type:complete len:143 (+) Transcript_20212:66-494(+)
MATREKTEQALIVVAGIALFVVTIIAVRMPTKKSSVSGDIVLPEVRRIVKFGPPAENLSSSPAGELFARKHRSVIGLFGGKKGVPIKPKKKNILKKKKAEAAAAAAAEKAEAEAEAAAAAEAVVSKGKKGKGKKTKREGRGE